MMTFTDLTPFEKNGRTNFLCKSRIKPQSIYINK
jgi:hypothetical protein